MRTGRSIFIMHAAHPLCFSDQSGFDSSKQKHNGSNICKSKNCSNPFDVCALQRHLNELKMRILARLHCNWCKYMWRKLKKYIYAFFIWPAECRLIMLNSIDLTLLPDASCEEIFSERARWRDGGWANAPNTCRHPAAHSRTGENPARLASAVADHLLFQTPSMYEICTRDFNFEQVSTVSTWQQVKTRGTFLRARLSKPLRAARFDVPVPHCVCIRCWFVHYLQFFLPERMAPCASAPHVN